MSERTPGKLTNSHQKGTPGHCWQAQIFDATGVSIACLDSTADPVVASDRARRLVAAWNACIGIDTVLLESLRAPIRDISCIPGLVKEADSLRAVNAELIKALEEIVSDRDKNAAGPEQHVQSDSASISYWSPSATMVHSEYIAKARAAIASTPAKGLTMTDDEKSVNTISAAWGIIDAERDSNKRLLDRIAALESKLAQQAEAQEPASGQARFRGDAWTQCTVEHVRMVQSKPEEWDGDYEVRLLFTRRQPAQLQRLSEEETMTAWRGVDDAGDDRRNAMLYGDAIQSALAAKNGAELK